MPACDDGQTNGTETDTDCGGECSPCADSERCAQDSDCQSDQCLNEVCTSTNCDDMTQNGDETDVDCGGADCGPCADDLGCLSTDCSGVCTNNYCQEPTSSDGVQNGYETDVDCGGEDAPACIEGQNCLEPSD